MIIIYILIVMKCIAIVFSYDYEDSTNSNRKELITDDLEFEPVISSPKKRESFFVQRNLNCDEFAKYALNCTIHAAFIYNSTRKSPPMPSKISDWCRSIRHLTSCAVDWNSDCKDVTDNLFIEESIRGHMYVVTKICDDERYLKSYDVLATCIEGAKDSWEVCYSIFKNSVDAHKNTTHEWTHYKTHFNLCCARAQFRRCTLDVLFDMPDICTEQNAVTLQKFSVIVSEGDVFQDCDYNMMYVNCPGGDPRPTEDSSLKIFLNSDKSGIERYIVTLGVLFLCLVLNTFLCSVLF